MKACRVEKASQLRLPCSTLFKGQGRLTIVTYIQIPDGMVVPVLSRTRAKEALTCAENCLQVTFPHQVSGYLPLFNRPL